MPQFETIDEMVIAAPAEVLFDTILDYPRMHEWYPRYRVSVQGGGEVAEGCHLDHELKAKGSPVTSRFVRTIHRIERPREIEESYDGGDLVGKGRWRFEPLDDGRTRVSFWCDVRSNSWLMHVGFVLGGERGHNMVYQDVLAALRARHEAAAA